MAQDYITRTTCRICDSTDLTPILDLGVMPPANSFLSAERINQPEKKFPLSVSFCKQCTLLQVLDVVSPEVLFADYDYLTSASKPLIDHFTKSAIMLADRFEINKEDLVVTFAFFGLFRFPCKKHY